MIEIGQYDKEVSSGLVMEYISEGQSFITLVPLGTAVVFGILYL